MYKELLVEIRDTISAGLTESVPVKVGQLNWAKNTVYPIIQIMPDSADRQLYVGGTAKEKLRFSIVYANRGTSQQAEELEMNNADVAEEIISLFKGKDTTIDNRRMLYQVPKYSLDRVLQDTSNYYVVGAAIEIQIEIVR